MEATSVLLLNCIYKTQSSFAMVITFVLTFFVLYFFFLKNERMKSAI